ncbi:hypothetical protein [Azospirillum argentinense]|uniref:hypothetical protein n=1 Tax=Azospirillum argentinense TaxID=2970906 RepID=UPI001A907518|nr:hypothetical protein [Azospirillum argentinense]
MGGDARRPVATHEGQVIGLPLIVGNGEYGAVGTDPFDAVRTLRGAAVRLPGGGIGAAQPEQRVLHTVQRQVLAEQLDDEDRHVDIVEEMQIDMGDGEAQRRLPPPQGDRQRRHVAPPEDADRRTAIAGPVVARFPLAIEEALHIGQEGHELAVMALAEFAGVLGELVRHLLPGAARPAQPFPMVLDLRARLQRHQLHRPQQDFAKPAHADRALVHGAPPPCPSFPTS